MSRFATFWNCFRIAALLMLMSVSGNAQQADEFPFRRIYVPESQPEIWPAGDWRPISPARLVPSPRTLMPQALLAREGRTRKAAYTARFEEGNLVDGSLELELMSEDSSAGWVRFGATSLCIQTLSWERDSENWGVGTEGRLMVYANSDSRTVSGSWTHPGQTEGRATRFDIELPTSSNSTVQLSVPERFDVKVDSQERVAVYVSEANNASRNWSIIGIEGNRLSLTVEPRRGRFVQPQMVSRFIHLLNVSASGTTFTTDFQFRMENRAEQECLIQFPANFEPQSAQFDQAEVLQLFEAVEQDESIRVYRFPFPPQSSPLATLRIRGRLQLAREGQLATGFPRVLNEVSLNGEVNVTVEAPYQIQSLSTSGLLQQSARFVQGTRDLWSYAVTEADPRVSLQAVIPEAQLLIDQIVQCRDSTESCLLEHYMLWTPSQSGVYQGEFHLVNGFQVVGVEAMSDSTENVVIDWTVGRRNGQNRLTIDLANQLTVREPVALRVTLEARPAATGQQQLTLPVLIPVSGRIRQFLLSEKNLQIVKTIPEQTEIAPATASSLVTALRKRVPASAGLQSGAEARLTDVTPATRIVVQRSSSESPETLPNISERRTAERCEVQTRLTYQEDRIVARYRIEIPPVIREQVSSLSWKMSVPGTQPMWKRPPAKPTSVATAGSTAMLYTNTDEASQQRWTSNWEMAAEGGSLIYEATLVWPDSESSTLPVPVVATDAAWQGQIESADPELIEFRTPADPDAVVSAPFEYGPTSSPPELTVRRRTEGEEDAAAAKASTWRSSVYALRQSTPAPRLQTQIDLVASDRSLEASHARFTFSTPVDLQSVWLNDTCIAVEEVVTEFELPDYAERIERVRLTYQSADADSIILPQSVLVSDELEIVLCVDKDFEVTTAGPVTYWRHFSPSDSFGQTGSLTELIRHLLSRGTHQAVSTQIKSPADHHVPLLGTRPELSWGWILWTFVIALVAFYVGVAVGVVPQKPLLAVTAIVFLALAFVPPGNWSHYAYPILAALLLVVQLGPAVEQWRRKRFSQISADGEGRPAINPMWNLLTGRLVLLIALFGGMSAVGRSQEPASPMPEASVATEAATSTSRREDVLIPVSPTKLSNDFQGLSLDQFPAVVYVRREVADRLRVQTPPRTSGNDVVFRSSSYRLRPDGRGQYSLQCDFEIIEKAPEPLSRFVLPINNISGISALRAEVNGQIVNMTPLPENKGLEIPLSGIDLSTLNLTSPPGPGRSFGRQSAPFRRYVVRVDVLPQQSNVLDATQLLMNVPAAARSQLIVPAELAPLVSVDNGWTSSGSSRFPSEETPESITWTLSPSDQLRIKLDEPGLTPGTAERSGLTLKDSTALAEVQLDVVEYTWQLHFDIRTAGRHEIELLLPRELIVQNIVGAELLGISLGVEEDDLQRARLELTPSAVGSAVVVVQFVALPESSNGDYLLTLPRLLPADSSRTTLLAIQTTVPGYRVAAEINGSSASRLTAESFQAVWREPAVLTPNVQCFRLTEPQQVRLDLDRIPSALSIDAEHTVSVEQKDVRLDSTYTGRSTGAPLWQLDLTNDLGWVPTVVTVREGTQVITTRVLREGRRVRVCLEQEVSEPFQLSISWQKQRSVRATRIDVTPPRVLNTTSQTESVRVVNAISRYQWELISPQVSQDALPQPARSESKAEQPEKALPEYTLRRTIMEEATPTPREGESQTGTTPFGDSTGSGDANDADQTAATIDRSMPLTLLVDHTLSLRNDQILGETLIVRPADGEQQKNEPTIFQVELPAGAEWIDHRSSDNLFIDDSIANVVSVTDSASLDEVTYVILHWRSPLQSRFLVDQRLALPRIPAATRTQWRVLHRSNSVGSDRTAVAAWASYLSALQAIGRDAAADPATNRNASFDASAFRNENPSLNEAARSVEQLMAESETAVARGWERIREQSWLSLSSHDYASVIGEGTTLGPESEIRQQHREKIPRWGLIVLSLTWGAGLLGYYAREKPLFKRRHLLVLSLMMIGLLLVLLTSA
ncbi:hypothetical protein [Rubinisphaera margarita]|uniref:hypothetical protein n=1 Tax=Rubinisphaera margarita TaxID=2909586 RepID=UPI001EE85865|nr:hypothetical protein [Rubinisphaera margarita]MCG6157184.1 hypothetical protein [Rubinisphaera margarita]